MIIIRCPSLFPDIASTATGNVHENRENRRNIAKKFDSPEYMPFSPALLQRQPHGAAPVAGKAVLDFRLEYVRESFRQRGLFQRLIAQLLVK